jgi:hypothetical protein
MMAEEKSIGVTYCYIYAHGFLCAPSAVPGAGRRTVHRKPGSSKGCGMDISLHGQAFSCMLAFKSLEDSMNEEAFNISIRKFLKIVGINSQRAIEQAVDKAVSDGAITGTETFPATMTLEVAGLKLNVKFDGEIQLE